MNALYIFYEIPDKRTKIRSFKFIGAIFTGSDAVFSAGAASAWSCRKR